MKRRDAHGGDVYAAAKELRRPLPDLLDYSASINPLGPSPRLWPALAQARPLIAHYPDPDAVALRSEIAALWRCPIDRVVAANGSAELIATIPRVFQLRHVLIIGPTFSQYAQAVEQAGGRVTMVHAERATGYRPPIDAVLESLQPARSTRTALVDAVILCNPNSPTAQAVDVRMVLRLARAAARRNILLILDEAFADYTEQVSVRGASVPWRQTIVLRSVTKFHALPGLRAGYAITSRARAAQIRAAIPPWSMNVLAQVGALAALKDLDHARRSRAFMAQERPRMSAHLGSLPGCRVYPSETNFIWFETPQGVPARLVTARLRRQGILVRDASTVPGATPQSLRIAVRTRPENDRLIRALARCLVLNT